MKRRIFSPSSVSLGLGLVLLGALGACGNGKDASAPSPSETGGATASTTTTTETSGSAGATTVPASGGAASSYPKVPLHTQSRYVVDADGKRFKLAGVNWYGAESATFVPDGLALRPRSEIAKLIVELGFNSVRLPFCNELIEKNPIVDAARVQANPDLVGKTSLEVLDAVIDSLAQQGLVILLDNHRSRGDWCCDTAHGDGLWYTTEYPEETFISHWQFMAERYKSQPMVVGADLRNELRGQLVPTAPSSCTNCDTPTADCVCEWASWGDNTGNNRDWTVVAERTGNAILEIQPNWLIIVEGPHWGTWLGAGYRHLTLNQPNRLVYSAHQYAMTGGFSNDCAAYKTSLDQKFGFVVEEGKSYTTPLWIGEFGIANTSTENAWWLCMNEYLKEKDLDWAYWPLNGTQGPGYGRTDGARETYGVLNLTWDAAANETHLAHLKALQAPMLGP
jgi:endoglucanase